MEKTYSNKKSEELFLGTRASPLAILQAEIVKKKLEQSGRQASLNLIKTTGDQIQNKPLNEIGGKGLFIKELEASLLRRETDLAIHSLKDLPCQLHEDFELISYLKRDYPHDVIILRKDKNFLENIVQKNNFLNEEHFKNLSSHKIATGSLRRSALIKKANKKIEVCPIRGNIGTRMKKLENKECDALILSEASIKRLGLNEELFVAYTFDPKWFIPCAGQGVIVIEALKEKKYSKLFQESSCSISQKCCTIERGILEALGGSCLLPIGVYCKPSGSTLNLHVLVINKDGTKELRHTDSFNTEEEISTLVQKTKKDLIHKNVNDVLKDLGISEISI